MYNVREKTLLEELQDLENLDQHDKDRLIKKYHDEQGREKELAYKEVHNLIDENANLKTEIKVMIQYIQLKEYV